LPNILVYRLVNCLTLSFPCLVDLTAQDQPTAEAAAAVGVPDVRPDGSSAATESLVNQSAIDLLRRLPGVNDKNCHNLMRACDSLAAIAALGKTELARIMGGEKVAQMLHDFLHAPCAAL
jgi:DNA excision repair protein ERCC-4